MSYFSANNAFASLTSSLLGLWCFRFFRSSSSFSSNSVPLSTCTAAGPLSAMLNSPSASASDSTVPGESSGISDEVDVDGAVATAVDGNADVTSSVLYLELLDMVAGDADAMGVAAALGGVAALCGTAMGAGTRLLDGFDVVVEARLGLRGDVASTG